jgi:nicotinamide-nucleotide adenylyltransferase
MSGGVFSERDTLSAEDRAELAALAQVMEALDPSGPPRIVFVLKAGQGVSQPGQRLGAFPSSFNPLTRAHVRMMEQALAEHGLAEVMLVVDKANVDKREVCGASLAERLWMLRRFAAGRPRLSVAASSHGRFVDKAKALQALYTEGTELNFIVGFDTLVRVFDPKYYTDPQAELEELFRLSRFIVANRGEASMADVERWLEGPVCRPFVDRIHLTELDPFHAHISSTEVRARIEQGRSFAELVPPEIVPLIPKTGLAPSHPRSAAAHPSF